MTQAFLDNGTFIVISYLCTAKSRWLSDRVGN